MAPQNDVRTDRSYAATNSRYGRCRCAVHPHCSCDFRKPFIFRGLILLLNDNYSGVACSICLDRTYGDAEVPKPTWRRCNSDPSATVMLRMVDTSRMFLSTAALLQLLSGMQDGLQ